jgi:succinate dehydrogenase / fumarate reductase, cytochrome b subunit
MTTLVTTVAETLRYRGHLGQLTWVGHRLSGVGTLIFLIIHVVDTSWAMFYPDLYAKAVAVYQSPLFTVGEFLLVAAVVYHALNGLRIILFDWQPKWWNRQADAARMVILGTLVIMIPSSIIMMGHVVRHYQEGAVFDLAIASVVESQLPFVVGTFAILGAGFLLSAVGSLIAPSIRGGNSAGLRRSRFDQFMWTFMRVSGVLIVPLVFGHLAMMHLIQGVFDITNASHIPVGTTFGTNEAIQFIANNPAANFVAHRWNTMVAGVFIWRVYDIALLWLVVIHGFNGLRYVANDYFLNPLVNRALRIAILITTILLLTVGSLAIINTVPNTVTEMLNESTQVIESVR